MNLNKINIIDIEATCWEGKDDIPQGQRSEIIEIGIVQLDIKTLEISKNRGILIKPRYSTVSPFCESLTSITQEMLDKEGIDIEDAVSLMIKEYGSPFNPWGSYGFYDQRMFRELENLYGIRYPLHNRHTNVKTLFAMLQGLTKEVGMDTALNMAGIPLEGTHHRGKDDAKNIAKLMAWIIGKHRDARPVRGPC